MEPKVRLQGYGYNLFCSHRSRCLELLVWQYFEEAFCAPKIRLKWYGFKGFPSHNSHCSGGLFPQHSGVSPKMASFSETPVCSQFCLFAIFAGFVRNFGWVFAILLEVLLIQIQEEFHHFAGWEGGVLRGTKIVNKNFVNKVAFPTF